MTTPHHTITPEEAARAPYMELARRIVRREILGTNQIADAIRAVCDRQTEQLRAELDSILFEVHRKWPNETRAQTARRYVQEAEASAGLSTGTATDQSGALSRAGGGA